MAVVFLISVLLCSGLASSNKITTAPSNGIFQAGTTIVLPCGVDTLGSDTLVWWEFQSSSTGNIICTITQAQGAQCDPKYSRYSIQSGGNNYYTQGNNTGYPFGSNINGSNYVGFGSNVPNSNNNYPGYNPGANAANNIPGANYPGNNYNPSNNPNPPNTNPNYPGNNLRNNYPGNGPGNNFPNNQYPGYPNSNYPNNNPVNPGNNPNPNYPTNYNPNNNYPTNINPNYPHNSPGPGNPRSINGSNYVNVIGYSPYYNFTNGAVGYLHWNGTHNDSRWWHNNGTHHWPIYRGALSTPTGMYNLVINNAMLTDAGNYRCGFVAVGGMSASATIIVFDKININVPAQSSIKQQIPVTCSVTFASIPYYQLQALKPEVILRVGSNQLAVSNDNMVPDKTQAKVSFSLNGTTEIQSYDQLPKSVTCFIGISTPTTTYTNSTPLNIYYPVQDVYINSQPMNGQYRVGDNITCTANGYPAPTITWSLDGQGTTNNQNYQQTNQGNYPNNQGNNPNNQPNTNNQGNYPTNSGGNYPTNNQGSFQSNPQNVNKNNDNYQYGSNSDQGIYLPQNNVGSSTITLTQAWVGKTHSLICSAVNEVAGSQPLRSNLTAFSVVYADGQSPHVSSASMGWIAAVVIVPVAVIVAIIVIICVLRRKRQNTPPKKVLPPSQQQQVRPGPEHAYVPISQEPDPSAPLQPGQLTPNGQHTRDSPGYGDLGVNRYGLPQGQQNRSASFDDNTSLNGQQVPTSHPPDVPNNGHTNRSPLPMGMTQQPGYIHPNPDTMV